MLRALSGLRVIFFALTIACAASTVEAQVKISALPSAGAINGTEAVPLVQGGITKQAPSNAIANSATSVTGLTLNGTTTLSGALTATGQTITGGTYAGPVLSGTVTGTYTLGGTPTISNPTLSGTVAGTYTLGGTPTLGAGLTATGQTITGGTYTGITLSGITTFPSGTSINGSGVLTLGTDLAVTSGGTGAGTFTTHGVLLGEGTSAFGVTAALGAGTFLQGTAGDPVSSSFTFPTSVAAHQGLVATGVGTVTAKTIPDCQDTTGNHLNYTQSTDAYSCGTTSNSAVVTSHIQVFTTAGSISFTAPAATISTTQFKFTIVGGGGSGAAAGSGGSAGGGGGGGAGACAIWYINGLVANNAYTGTVGASATNSSMTIGTTVTANAGSNGTAGGAAVGGSGGAGGTSSGGSLNIPGGAGDPGEAATTNGGSGGSGGTSCLGGGGAGAPSSSNTTGGTGAAFGSGGGGGEGLDATAGGAGKQGVIFVEWVL